MGTAHTLSAAALLLWVALAAAHPFHGSLAEIDWNQSGDALEVALRVDPEALEKALGGEQPPPLENISDPSLERWLTASFRVLDETSAVLPLELVGREVSYDQTWLYFTVAARRSQRLTLDNRVLLEVNPGQANRLRLLWDPGAGIRVFSAGQTRELLWPGEQ